MIEYIENGNLFESRADALINPVNCRGVMGKGIALEFKKRFPEYFRVYRTVCHDNKLHPGLLLFVQLNVLPDSFFHRYPGVIMFPTKDHWKDKSKIEWIEKGLQFLNINYEGWGLHSVAMPQIGCGLGGLSWQDVKPLIDEYFINEDIRVEVHLQTVNTYKEKFSEKDVQTSL